MTCRETWRAMARNWMLADEIKLCDINLDEPDEPDSEPA